MLGDAAPGDAAREQPGREVDLIAHSQGGIVVDEFLAHVYDAGDTDVPPLGNVVTLSSPHEGAPLATAGRRSAPRRSGVPPRPGRDACRRCPAERRAAVHQLAEGSPLLTHLWDHGVPDHFDFTTIGATEDLVVPGHADLGTGPTETVAAVDSLNEHARDRARAPTRCGPCAPRWSGRPPPCVGLFDRARAGAVSPVEHDRPGSSIATLGRGRPVDDRPTAMGAWDAGRRHRHAMQRRSRVVVLGGRRRSAGTAESPSTAPDASVDVASRS